MYKIHQNDTASELQTLMSLSERAEQLTRLFHTAPPVDTSTVADVLTWAGKLQALGVFLFAVAPGDKVPATARGLKDATDDPDELAEQYRPGMNLGIHLGRSGLLVIDADTVDEVTALQQWWGDTLPAATVATPGTSNGHTGGGHWYIAAGTDVSTSLTKLRVAPDGSQAHATVMSGESYTVAPGSFRTDVADPTYCHYQARGDVIDTIVDVLASEINRKRQATAGAKSKRQARSEFQPPTVFDQQVEQWEENNSWYDLLSPHGWLPYASDTCGCETWTRPGAVNPKSATAHTAYGCHSGYGDIFHVWSDNADPFEGGGTYTKLQTYAELEHDGDMSAAIDITGVGLTGTPFDPSTITIDRTAPNVFALKGVNIAAPPRRRDITRSVDTGCDDSELWGATEWLKAVKRWAWVRHVDPYAVLLVVLSEVALRVPPHIVMSNPSDVSLNLITMNMAPPSGGKGVATSTGRKLVHKPFANGCAAVEIQERTGFSGQGLGRAYTYTGRVEQPDNWTAPHIRFVESEVKNLISLSSSSTSTQIPVLNKFYMGAEMGATNSGSGNSWSVEAHTYRGVLHIEAQDDVVGPLLTGDVRSSGFSSRLIVARPQLTVDGRKEWKRQRDNGVFDTNDIERPAVSVDLRKIPATVDSAGKGLVSFPTDPAVIRCIEDASLCLQDGDNTAAHEGLRRRKVATLMAIASGEWELTPQWWHLAGYVMDNHRAVLDQWHKDQATARHDQRVKAAARELAVRQQATEELLNEQVDKVVAWVGDNVDADGVKWAEVHRRGPSRRWDKDTREKVRDILESDPRVRIEQVRQGWRIYPAG